MYTSVVSARPGLSNPTVALSISPDANEARFTPAESCRLLHSGSPAAPGRAHVDQARDRATGADGVDLPCLVLPERREAQAAVEEDARAAVFEEEDLARAEVAVDVAA